MERVLPVHFNIFPSVLQYISISEMGLNHIFLCLLPFVFLPKTRNLWKMVNLPSFVVRTAVRMKVHVGAICTDAYT